MATGAIYWSATAPWIRLGAAAAASYARQFWHGCTLAMDALVVVRTGGRDEDLGGGAVHQPPDRPEDRSGPWHHRGRAARRGRVCARSLQVNFAGWIILGLPVIPDSAPNCACAAGVTLVDATSSSCVTTQSLRGPRRADLGSLSTDLGTPPKSANHAAEEH